MPIPLCPINKEQNPRLPFKPCIGAQCAWFLGGADPAGRCAVPVLAAASANLSNHVLDMQKAPDASKPAPQSPTRPGRPPRVAGTQSPPAAAPSNESKPGQPEQGTADEDL